jgi:acid phosphatase type 7
LTYGAFKFLTRPAPGNHEFYDEHGATGVAGYGYFSYFNGFQVDTTRANRSRLRSRTRAHHRAEGVRLSGRPLPTPNPYRGRMDRRGTSSSRADSEPQYRRRHPVGVGDGWYSYNLGSWHLISLNIECSTQPGGCSTTGSWFAAELEWLKKDLEANHSACTAAYWHQPTFSATNSITPRASTAQAFWQLLYEYGADLVLNGHDHLYARYRPLDPNGNYDPRKGIREFIVGTGGETLDPIVITPDERRKRNKPWRIPPAT